MYLIDTNIFLEVLLEQEKADDVRRFFSLIRTSEIFLTDLSLHSIGIILIRLKKKEIFTKFIIDIREGDVQILSLDLEDMDSAVRIVERFKLDFDDAYQYAIAQKHDLQLVSFDKDFDRTEKGKREPSELIK